MGREESYMCVCVSVYCNLTSIIYTSLIDYAMRVDSVKSAF